jgi:hypothetical protein
MKKLILLSSLVLFGITLSGCINNANQTPAATNQGDTTKPAIEQKQGDTTITGTITKAGSSFFITEAGKAPKGIDSYAIDLSQYEGQTVTITGQYSGDTLFVGKIE